MKTKYIQLLKGCIALIITVSCLYTGQAVWQNYAVDLPLDKALKGIEGVEKVTWDDGHRINDGIAIIVTLNNTANLQKTHKELSKRIEQTLKGKKYTLEIQDNRTPELEQSYYDINYYIQKSIVDGDFPLLEDKVQKNAKTIGATARLFVDDQNIYLQLTKGSSNLYAVVARNSAKIGGNF